MSSLFEAYVLSLALESHDLLVKAVPLDTLDKEEVKRQKHLIEMAASTWKLPAPRYDAEEGWLCLTYSGYPPVKEKADE